MSTVRLTQAQEGLGKAGETVSVPFGRGRDLINAGLAEYPPQPAGKGQPVTASEASQLVAARKRIGDLERENKRLREDNAELKELLEDADKTPAK